MYAAHYIGFDLINCCWGSIVSLPVPPEV